MRASGATGEEQPNPADDSGPSVSDGNPRILIWIDESFFLDLHVTSDLGR